MLRGSEYPTVLQQQLAFRYTAQALQVTNEGTAGEYAGRPGTLTRFRQVLATRAPEVVLIMEGTNDLFDVDPMAITPAIDNLRTMIRDARIRNVRAVHRHCSADEPAWDARRPVGAWWRR